MPFARATLVSLLLAVSCACFAVPAGAADEMYGFLEKARNPMGGWDRLRVFDLTDGSPSPPGGATPWLQMNQFGLDFSCDGTLWGFGQSLPGPGGSLQNWLFQVDLGSGTLIYVDGPYTAPGGGSLGLGGHGFEFGPDGVPYVFVANQLHRVETGPPTVVPIGPPQATRHSNLALGADGLLYTVGIYTGGAGPNTFMTVDPSDGSLTVLGTVDVPRISTLEFTPDGRLFGYCFACSDDVGTGDKTMVEMDPNTGARVPAGMRFPNARVRGMAWGPDNPIGPCAPICDAGADDSIGCGEASGGLQLDGQAQTPTGNDLDVLWTSDCGATFDDPTRLDAIASFDFACGDCTLTLTVTDQGNGATCESSKIVSVVDDEAPVVTATADLTCLWPPNHAMVDIGLNVLVTDNCDPEPSVEILGVTSDETTATQLGAGGGKRHCPDAVITTDGVQLRAERSGNEDGRVYTITVLATDSCGNATETAVTVSVPHDQDPKTPGQVGGNDADGPCPAIDSGRSVDATACN